jgi:hypothetical protein
MIVVKVELHSAITGEVLELGRTVIYNDGTGSSLYGNYICRAYRQGYNLEDGLSAHVVKEGTVKNYPRYDNPIWNLVAKALKAMKYE